MFKQLLLTIIVLMLFLTACAEAPTLTAPPAPQATATAAATNTPLPAATATSAPAVATATTMPATATATVPAGDETATEPATATATIMATPEPQPLQVTEPGAAANVTVAADLMIAGTVDVRVTQVDVALRAGGHVLATATITVDGGNWSGSVAVPANVTGPAQLIVSAGAEQVIHSVVLVRAATAAGSTITLNQPTAAMPAVAGHVLFFAGTVSGAIEEEVSIGVLFEDCQTFAASQTFTVTTGRGNWRGLVIIPRTVTGPVCAVAYTGMYGQGDWREAQVPLTILDPADEAARQIWLGNPAALALPGNGTVFLFGAAIGAPGNEARVEIRADDGTVLAETTVDVDAFGYWETNLSLTNASAGQATIWLSHGEGESMVINTYEAVIE